jgi:hypothetical protein
MKPTNTNHIPPKLTNQQTDRYGRALERWQELVEEANNCTAYMFAVLVGLAAPLVHLVMKQRIVINFHGSDPIERKRLLQLALSCWIDPVETYDEPVEVTWKNKRTKLGFIYAVHSDMLSVDQIKNAVTNGEAGMAVVCGAHALSQAPFGKEVIVVNVDLAYLEIERELGASADTIRAKLSSLSKGYAGDFLIQYLRESTPRLRNMRNRLTRQADYEYRQDLMRNIIPSVRSDDPEAFDSVPELNISAIPWILSVIEGIAVIAQHQGMLPQCQVFATISNVYSGWSKSRIEAARHALDNIPE